MTDLDKKMERLLRSAAQAQEGPPAAAPFGFDTRVVALWRTGAVKPNGLASLVRRVTLLSAIVTIIAAAAGFREVQNSREAGDSLTDEFAIADSAIQSEFLK